MPLPKTYWNKLSEKAQIQFFNIYMLEAQREVTRDYACVSTFTQKTTTKGCEYLCKKLFKLTGPHLGECPCHAFHGNTAFLALEKALIDNGWIEDESVC